MQVVNHTQAPQREATPRRNKNKIIKATIPNTKTKPKAQRQLNGISDKEDCLLSTFATGHGQET